LNRHCGPIEPVSGRSVRTGLSAQVCQLQPFQSRRICLCFLSSSSVKCAGFFCDRSLLQKLCRPRSKENIFLSLPRRSVRAAGCAENIFLSQPSKRVLSGRHADFCFYPQPRSNAGRAELFLCAAFSFVVRSHLRRHFVLIFCGAWNLCSTLFQNPASEI
jgi:hypothetical protein